MILPGVFLVFLIITRRYFHGVEEEKDNELELLVVPLVGFRPRCAMVVAPPGISSGAPEQVNARARHSECSF